MTGVYKAPAGDCPDDADPQRTTNHRARTSLPAIRRSEMLRAAYKYELGKLPCTVNSGGWHPRKVIAAPAHASIIKESSTHGLYAILDQMIYRLPRQGPERRLVLPAA